MARFRLSSTLWRWFICCAALLSAILLLVDASHAVDPLLISGEQGSIGVKLVDQIGGDNLGQGTYRLRIESVAPGSALQAAGAAPGDYLRFDHYVDRWRKLAIGEPVGLTLYRGNLARHLVPLAQPEKIPFADYVDYCGRLLIALPALLFGLMISFKQSESRAYRALSLAFILLSFMYFYSFSYAPDGPALKTGKFLSITAYCLVWYSCAVFALSYQPYPGRLRTLLGRLLSVYGALSLATAVYAVGFALGWETPLLWVGSLLGGMFGLALVLICLLDGWRRSIGEVRQRHLWLLLALALGAIPAVLTRIPPLDAQIAGVRVTVLMYFFGQLMMYCGLAYAVLKYRVFNFDFAISRAVVFSVVSVLLLCSFGIIEWIYASVMHGGASVGHGRSQKSLLVDAGLALAAYLVFHKIHGTVERWVERFLFEKWHTNERRLRAYVRQAAHFTTVDALLESFCAALQRFSGQAGCAVYQRQDSGDYRLVAGNLDGADGTVGANDITVVALRTDLAPVLVDHPHADLALPMTHRGMLDGFVLMGRKRRGDSYRPDESEALGFAATHVGLDLHALRVDELQREVDALARKADRQSEELELMAGRRRSGRAAMHPTNVGDGVTSW